MHPARVMSSDYMYWAKTSSQARFNLANSGVVGYSLRDLPARIEDLEINGPSYYGFAPLQDAIARKCGVTSENVVTTNGASMANFMVMAALLGPGDEVLIEHPTYELLVSAARYLGAEVKRFPRHFESGFRIDVPGVARLVSEKTRLIILTNLHNPSNTLTDEATLIAVGQLAAGVKARVMVGEIYLDSVFESTPRSAVHLGPEFLTTSSLTKVYGLSGLRCGWILAEAELATRIWRLNDLIANHQPHVSEQLNCLALANLDQIRAHYRAFLDTNHAAWRRFVAKRSDLEVLPSDFGTVSFPRLKHGSVDRLCELLRSHHETTLVPGRFFEMPEHFRIGLGCKPEDFAIGIERLGKALDDLNRSANVK